ncbi:MAG TPA: hypothetical protein VF981_17520 [Gemmatimonadaceae bacterium]
MKGDVSGLRYPVSRRPLTLARAGTGILLALANPIAARGQATLPPATGTPGVAGEMRSVEGRVLRGGPGNPEPLGGQFVVLHRISADSAGPVDSMRTPASGQYRFRYRLASTSAMYIVSSRYAGVAYFTAPLRAATVAGPDADLLVFDTTSRAFPLTVRGRHFVVSPPDPSGVRRVVDVFEVANDSSRTLVVGSGTDATWRARMPDGVRDPRSSRGDLPPDAIRFSGGSASLAVPFPPGSRQIVLTYGVPAGAPVTIPVDDPTASLEVLVEGSGVEVSGASLAVEPSVTMEGRTFQRYVASSVNAGASFTVQWGGGGGLGGRAGRVALPALAAVAVAAGLVFGRRNRSADLAAARPPAPAVSEAESLAGAIAALDDTYSVDARQDAASQARYRERRDAMKSRLVAALAVEQETDAS